MGSKTITLANLAASQREKGAKARARRVQKRRTRSPVKWLGKEWAAIHHKYCPDVEAVEWTGAEAALARKLVDEYGFDAVLKLITHFFQTWNRRSVAQTGVPGMKLLWVMRSQLFAEMEGKIEVPQSHASIIASGEYHEEIAKTNPDHGWGEPDEDTREWVDSGW